MTSLPVSEIRALREALAHPHGTGSGRQCMVDIEMTPHESEPTPHEPEAALATHYDDHHTYHRRSAKTPVQSVDIDQTTTTWAPWPELLTDLTRLRLLPHTHTYPDSRVQDLAKAAGTTQTATSQALRVSRGKSWVSAQYVGCLMRYTLKDMVAHQMLHFIGHTHV